MRGLNVSRDRMTLWEKACHYEDIFNADQIIMLTENFETKANNLIMTLSTDGIINLENSKKILKNPIFFSRFDFTCLFTSIKKT